MAVTLRYCPIFSIIMNKVLIQVTLNKVITGALYISVAKTL